MGRYYRLNALIARKSRLPPARQAVWSFEIVRILSCWIRQIPVLDQSPDQPLVYRRELAIKFFRHLQRQLGTQNTVLPLNSKGIQWTNLEALVMILDCSE